MKESDVISLKKVNTTKATEEYHAFKKKGTVFLKEITGKGFVFYGVTFDLILLILHIFEFGPAS